MYYSWLYKKLKHTAKPKQQHNEIPLFTPTKMAIIKKLKISVDEDVEKLELSYTAGGM